MRVLLLNMPFSAVLAPNLGISLLKARLLAEGIECVTAYPSLSLAECDYPAYQVISQGGLHTLMVGEWLFAPHVFGDQLDWNAYASKLQNYLGEKIFQTVMRLRPHIGHFLGDCMSKLRIPQFDLIGFSTMFQQNLSSIALARAIKERYPNKAIVFGGAGCQSVMGLELHRSFPWLDYVFTGEADYGFPEFVKRLADHKPLRGITGLVYRDLGRSILSGPSDVVRDLDSLPYPDYDEYMEALRGSSLSVRAKSPLLFFESSRGCWWGQKHQCTFCGFNGQNIAFRAKSGPRVLSEIEHLTTRYGPEYLQATDTVLPREYFQTLFPALTQRQLPVKIHYETKANLTRQEIELLHDAGVSHLQPGIESLNTHVLTLMRKGVTLLQNIQTLKWCREYGIKTPWNILYGLPGETAEDYRDSAKVALAISHLPPPLFVGRIQMFRFSPNFQEAASRGFVNLKPIRPYGSIYRLPPESVYNLAYWFDFGYSDGRNPQACTGALVGAVKEWKAKPGNLWKCYGTRPELLLIDTRLGQSVTHALNGLEREIYEFSEEIRSKNEILRMAQAKAGDVAGLERVVDSFLHRMEDQRLMLREGNQYLSLAISSGAWL